MFFSIDEEYKDTELHLILCNGHIHHYLIDEHVNTLEKNLDFKDTKSLLLSESQSQNNSCLVIGHLKTTKSLEIYDAEDGRHISTNLAQSSDGKKPIAFTLLMGYSGYICPKKKINPMITAKMVIRRITLMNLIERDLFRISILDKDKIAVVILKDDSRYVLERVIVRDGDTFNMSLHRFLSIILYV